MQREKGKKEHLAKVFTCTLQKVEKESEINYDCVATYNRYITDPYVIPGYIIQIFG